MFDKYDLYTSPSSQNNTHTHTHHEHRAPTDESVRLLREMEKTAQDAVIERIDLKNGMKGTIIRTMSLTPFGHRIIIAFELNGEKYQTLPVEVEPSFVMDRNEWVKKLLEEMSRAIVVQLLMKHGFKDLTGF